MNFTIKYLNLLSKAFCLFGAVILITAPTLLFASQTETIRFAVMGLGKPGDVYKAWQPFMDNLSKKTGYKIELSVRQKPSRIAKMVKNNEVDFVFLNSLLFDGFQNENKLLPVAQVQNIEGNWYSKSVIFVRGDSGINSFKDLKGVNMSYLGKASPGGYLAPRAVMENKGLNTVKDIDEHFTSSVSTSIHNVILGKTKAGAICNVMYNLLSRKLDTGELQVIGESELFPEGVIGANTKLEKTVIENIQKTIIAMKDSKEGEQVFANLYNMKIGRFVPYHTDSAQMIKKLKEDAQFPG